MDILKEAIVAYAIYAATDSVALTALYVVCWFVLTLHDAYVASNGG